MIGKFSEQHPQVRYTKAHYWFCKYLPEDKAEAYGWFEKW